MTATNRALNRLLLFCVGVLLLLAGLCAALIGSLASALDLWRPVATTAVTTTERMLSASPLAGTGISWAWFVLLALLTVVVLALVVFVVRQGRGRTTRLLSTAPTEHGHTLVDAAFAEQALEHSLVGHSDFLGVNASTYRVKGASMLRVSVTARRGAAPRDVIDAVEASVRGLDGVLGREIPVFLQIGGGLRSRLAGATRLAVLVP